ncbi:cation:proton antiporter [Dehalococcoidia bacterium]|nr:cation:proton antiporter [Dehalococcoidia bacterium]
MDVFYEIAVLLLIAAAIGGLAMRLRQPMIVGFILVGILVGPAVLGVVVARDEIDLMAQMGIALLLFVVGLKLDLRLVRTMGRVALIVGLGQVLFTSVIGYLIALALGLEPVAALFVAVALTFSSTIIIVKLLSDKREVDSLHGHIAVGVLIVQDIVVVLVMIGLSAFGAVGELGALGHDMLMVLLKGMAFLAGIGLLMRFVLPALLRQLARSQELLILFAIAWAVVLAALGDALGLSKEMGALLAGMSLASTPYRESIGARLVSLRDFLLLFFFISLGSNLDLGLIGAQIGPAIVLSLFVLIGNPLIVMVIMRFMDYRSRTSFLTGLTVAQISEFSLILAAMALALGLIGAETMGLITLVGLITIGLSTYLILYSHPIHERLSPYLRIFERPIAHCEDAICGAIDAGAKVDVILFGLGRYGGIIAQELRDHGIGVLGVDFDPDVIARWHDRNLPARYGDAEDPEFPSLLPLHQSHWVVSTVRHGEVNRILLRSLRHNNYAGRIALTAHRADEARNLAKAGVDLVLMPFVDAAEQAVDMLLAFDKEKLATQACPPAAGPEVPGSGVP